VEQRTQPQRQRQIKTALFDCATERMLDLEQTVVHGVGVAGADRARVGQPLAVREVRLQRVQQQFCPLVHRFDRTKVAFDEPLDALQIMVEQQDQRLQGLTPSSTDKNRGVASPRARSVQRRGPLEAPPMSGGGGVGPD
jgi:hypothetical protein